MPKIAIAYKKNQTRVVAPLLRPAPLPFALVLWSFSIFQLFKMAYAAEPVAKRLKSEADDDEVVYLKTVQVLLVLVLVIVLVFSLEVTCWLSTSGLQK